MQTLPRTRRGSSASMHGGAAPQVQRKAAQRQAEVAAHRILDIRGAPAVSDPLTALAEVAGEALALKDALAETVADLGQVRYQGHIGEQIHGEIKALLAAMHQSERLLVAMAKLGLDERLVRVNERQAQILADVVEAVFASRELTPHPWSDRYRAAAHR